jgi:hypothetical protein
MKKVLLCLLFVASPSFAWVSGVDKTIEEILAWENLDNGAPLHFKMSDGNWCYVPSGQKTLHSMILAIYVSGRKVEYHCYDTADSSGGNSVAPARKLHRIISR